MIKIRIPNKKQRKGKELYTFQVEGIKGLLKSPAPHLWLADGMGLGKTVQALVFANSIYADNVLIICPASIRLNWLRESNIWYNMRKKQGYPILATADVKDIQRSALYNPGYYPSPVIVSYDLVASSKPVQSYLASREWDLMILDEADAIRNWHTKRSITVLKLWEKCCQRVLCLSGTPIASSAMDLFPTLYRMIPHVKGLEQKDYKDCSSPDHFGRAFCYKVVDKYSPTGFKYTKVRDHKRLRNIMVNKGKLMVRRIKENVLKELPNKTYSEVPLNLKVNDDIDQETLAKIEEAFKQNNTHQINKYKKGFASIRRELGEAKAKAKDTYEYIETIIKESGCVVIFFYHKNVRDLIKAKLGKKHKIVVHDGDTTPTTKQANVDKFQNGKADIFLAQVESAVGYTVTRASDAVYIEYPWLSTVMNQSTDRLHRIGQKNAVTLHLLVANNPLDNKLIKLMISKQMTADKILQEGKYEKK